MRKRHATVKNDVPTMEPNQSRRRCAPMGWQLTSGWGGRLPLDCMAALHGIGWQESSEYAGGNIPLADKRPETRVSGLRIHEVTEGTVIYRPSHYRRPRKAIQASLRA
jgi:hypothetical protein